MTWSGILEGGAGVIVAVPEIVTVGVMVVTVVDAMYVLQKVDATTGVFVRTRRQLSCLHSPSSLTTESLAPRGSNGTNPEM